MMAYIVNMPAELLKDGHLAYLEAKKESQKIKRDRFLRQALLLLYSALEAEINRQLGISSYRDSRRIDEKLSQVLAVKGASHTTITTMLRETDVTDPTSFRNVRNGIAHFKNDYSLYGITESNIDRYYSFTKDTFEIIHTPSVVAEWLK